jgi:hypothetical protein
LFSHKEAQKTVDLTLESFRFNDDQISVLPGCGYPVTVRSATKRHLTVAGLYRGFLQPFHDLAFCLPFITLKGAKKHEYKESREAV